MRLRTFAVLWFVVLACLFCLCWPGALFAQAGFVTVSQTHLTDANGNPANAQVCAQANDLTGNPISLQVGGGGVTTVSQVCTNAVSGAWSMRLPDVSRSSPLYAGFNVTAIDNVSGLGLIGPGYNYVQPTSAAGSQWCSGTACNFDLLPPMNRPTLAAVVQGPPGIPGTIGPPGAPGGPLSTSTTAGGAVMLLSGTKLIAVGESNMSGYGDGSQPWLSLLAANNPSFAGRTTYQNYAFAGATVDDEMTEYTSTTTFPTGGFAGTIARPLGSVQSQCRAATGAAPVYLFIATSFNNPGTGSPYTLAQLESKHSALWQQALSDGCRVFALTVPMGPVNAANLTTDTLRTGMNNYIRTTTGQYNVLLDLDGLMPFDCQINYAGATVNCLGPNYFGTDCCHYNLAGHTRIAEYVGGTILNSGGSAPITPRWLPNYADRVVNTVSGSYLYAGPAAGDLYNCTDPPNQGPELTAAQIPGFDFVIRNRGVNACTPYLGTGSSSFEGLAACTSGVQCPGPPLQPGDTIELYYDGPAGGGGTFLVKRSVAPSPHLRTLTSSNNGSASTDQVIDAAGQIYTLESASSASTPVGTTIVVTNSASANASIYADTGKINGRSTYYFTTTLAQYQAVTLVYLGSSLGWFAH